MAKITQIAGRNALGTFAPDFAHFNDDILFGENWNNEDIDLKTINEQIQNIAQKKDTLCRRMYN